MPEYPTLNEMVQELIIHSVLRNGELNSIVFVNLPVRGGDHILKLTRPVLCDLARDRSAEEAVAPEILAREVKYILDFATTASEPVYQEDEDGTKTCIGQSAIFIDRMRLAYPTIQEKDGVKYLDCVSRIE